LSFKKKIITISLALSLSLTGAASAFAYDGWADSTDTAYQLGAPIFGVSTVIDQIYDLDWYSWTNNTGSSKELAATLQSPDGLKYDFVIIYPDNSFGIFSTSVPGERVTSTYSTIAAGETVYFQVRGQTADQHSATEPYNFFISYE